MDIQRNVHKNYTQFILISKEIAQIEADTSVLREIFSELRAICDGMLTDVGIVETVHGDARVVQHARSNDSSLDAGSRVLRGTGDGRLILVCDMFPVASAP